MAYRPRILVVDDNVELRRIVADSLSDADYEPIIAASGAEALEMLDTTRPDLVVLDVMMPLVDGFEVMRRIREDSRFAYLPVILLTGMSSSQDLVTGLRSGADDYIIKPFSLDELEARIKTHLRRSWRERQLNPLTLLPGNLAIEQELEDRIHSVRGGMALLIDLDNFKAYNDRYGFIHGDRVLQFVGALLSKIVAALDAGMGFVGHIGGDDFFAITSLENAEAIAREIVCQFDAGIGDFYEVSDRQNGFVEGVNRRGEVERFPLLTVSIAGVAFRPGQIHHLAEISHISAQLKSRLKAMPGSNYLFDRRQNSERNAEQD